jgi:sugar/nucleoside kinase (ribokinase family)
VSSNDIYDVMMIGHFAKDRIVVDGQGETISGGAVYYGSVALRHLQKRVVVVTRLHPKDYSRLEELRREEIQVVATSAPDTSGIENIYNSANMERRLCRPLGFAGSFQPGDIPDIQARIYAIVPIMAGEVDLSLLKALAARGPVALDIQGFVRVRAENELRFKPWPALVEGLPYVTYLKADRAEAELLTGLKDLTAAARRLAQLGPREIILTQTSGVTVYAAGQIHQAPFKSRSLAGRTGRGDTCFAVYLGKRLTDPPDQAVRWAGAVTSLKQEQQGPWRGSIDQIERMIHQK